MPVDGEVQQFLRSFGLEELREFCRRVEVPCVSALDKESLINRLKYRFPTLSDLVCDSGPVSADEANQVVVEWGGNLRKAYSDIRGEFRNRLVNGDEEDRKQELADYQARRLPGLREILRRKSWFGLLRDAIEAVDRRDREIFRALAKNSPGPGRPLERLEQIGFVKVRSDPDDFEYARDRNRALVDAQNCTTEIEREKMFERMIQTVHRLAPNHRIYVGRTYVRVGALDRGLTQRWESHRSRKRVTHGWVCGVVPSDRVERDEALAIALVKVWQDFDALCCDNDVLDSFGPVSQDAKQCVYMCVRPRPSQRE